MGDIEPGGAPCGKSFAAVWDRGRDGVEGCEWSILSTVVGLVSFISVYGLGEREDRIYIKIWRMSVAVILRFWSFVHAVILVKIS
jgi:hypothetical protein